MKTSKKQKEAIEMLDKFITEHKLYNIKQSDTNHLKKKLKNFLKNSNIF